MLEISNPFTSHFRARWWQMRADGRIECTLCPRRCKLRDGQHGFCVVRRRVGDHLELGAYGRSSGFCIDPIEKKPLYHFLPGTSALSFGTTGCNLGCRFCQNWDITKVSVLARLSEEAAPEQIVAVARQHGCRSVAFTYNDPVISAEYAIDIARVCHAEGIKTVAVTAGYISDEARMEFFDAMDAANVDLKAFDDDFYRRICLGHLRPVLDTLLYLHRETSVWLEVTTLLIPGENDDEVALERAAEWFATPLGSDVPWHFTAYHPELKLFAPPTPQDTLERAREIALSHGVRHVYTGNVRDSTGGSTWGPACGELLIQRDGYRLEKYRLNGNRCHLCQWEIPGLFESAPGCWEGISRAVSLSSAGTTSPCADPNTNQEVEASAARKCVNSPKRITVSKP